MLTQGEGIPNTRQTTSRPIDGSRERGSTDRSPRSSFPSLYLGLLLAVVVLMVMPVGNLNSANPSTLGPATPNASHPASLSSATSVASPSTAPASPSSTRANASCVQCQIGEVAVGSEPDGAVYDAEDSATYISNWGSDSVSILDGMNVLATLPVGAGPTRGAYDSANGDVYIPNGGTDSVSVLYDTSVAATITVGAAPWSAAYNPSNGYVYVANNHANSVSVISGTSVIDTIPVGSEPSGIAYDLGSNVILVTNFASNNVTVISGESVTKNVGVGLEPDGIVYGVGSGETYVANWGSSNVTAFKGSKPVANISVGAEPSYIAYDPEDYQVYVPNKLSDNVSAINTNYVSNTISIVPSDGFPNAAAYDAADNDVYVADYNAGLVSVLSTAQTHEDAWTNLTPDLSTAPLAVRSASMVYDAADGYDLFFGGCTATGSPIGQDETWTYEDGVWTQLHPALSPPGRCAAGLAYDAADGYVVLFGGGDPTNSYAVNDTWTFRAGVWTELHPSRAPSPRCGPFMTYDAADGYVLLFGGYDGSDPSDYNDTWKFVGGQWTPLALPQAPNARDSDSGTGSMAYDSALSEVVLYGGNVRISPSTLRVGNDTWIFKAGAWTNLTHSLPQSPPARMGNALVYSSSLGGMVLFGGLGGASRSDNLQDTWLFFDGAWSELTTPLSPPSRVEYAASTDPANGNAILFGGRVFNGSNAFYLNDTWSLGPIANPLTGVDFTTNPDEVHVGQSVSLSVTVSGGASPYSYTYAGLPAGCASENVSSFSCTPSAAGVYNMSVLVTCPTCLSREGGDILEVFPVSPPSLVISSFVATPDELYLGNSTTLTVTSSGGVLPYSFAYANLPTGCASTNLSSLLCTPSATGVFNVTVTVSGPGGEEANATVEITVLGVPAPLLVSLSASPASGFAPLNVSLVASASGGTGPYLYSWSFESGATGTGATVSQLFESAGNYTVGVTVTDLASQEAQATTVIVVYPAPSSNQTGAIELSLSAKPVTGTAPLTTQLTASATGGHAPYSFNWSFGDGAVGNGSSVSHTYLVSGEYVATVAVTDSRGNQAVSGVIINVSEGTRSPLLVLVGAVNMHGTAPLPVTFSPVVVGGSGRLELTWNFGDGSKPVTELGTGAITHVYTTAGVFHPDVRVTDPSGASTNWSYTAPLGARTVSVAASPPHSGSGNLALQDWVLVGVVVVMGVLAALGVMIYRSRRRRIPPVAEAALPTPANDPSSLSRGLPPGGPTPPRPPTTPEDDPFRDAV